jgi:hypothetical protein
MQYNEYPVSITSTTKPADPEKLTRSDFDEETELAGWISPQGRYYRVTCLAGHSFLARRLTKDEHGDKLLENAGWAHLGMHGVVTMVGHNRLTRAQTDTLWQISMISPQSDFAHRIIAAINRTVKSES